MTNPDSLIKNYGAMVTTLAKQYLRDEALAQDAAQECWIAVLRALPGFRGDSEEKTWVFRIVVRTLQRFRKKEEKSSFLKLREQYQESNIRGPALDDPIRTFWLKETCLNCMRGVLVCLDSRSRLVFLLRFCIDFEYSAIASCLGTTSTNVRKIYSRAREDLAKFMKNDCAYSRSDRKCRYGLGSQAHEIVMELGVQRLHSFNTKAWAFRALPHLLPNTNYWDKFFKDIAR